MDEDVNIINTTYTNRTTGEEKRGISFKNTGHLKWLKEELDWREKLTSKEKSTLFEITNEEKKTRKKAKKRAKVRKET